MEKRRPTDDAKRTGSWQKRRNPARGRRGRAAPTFFGYGHDPRSRGNGHQAGAHGRPDGSTGARL